MTTPLEKTLKRELHLKGQAYIVTLSPEGLKLTLKGRRNGVELRWESLVSGDAALAVALNASLGKLQPTRTEVDPKTPTPPKKSAGRLKR
jgi:hypothetical protein